MGVLANIRAFRWRLFMHRLATKGHLFKRGISFSPNEFVCALCLSADEDINHLFFDCPVAIMVWGHVGSWIGYKINVLGPSWKFFLEWNAFFKSLSNNGNINIIWFVWRIWKSRNDVIFNEAKCDLNNIVWFIMFCCLKIVDCWRYFVFQC